MEIYIVKSGDTIIGIADYFGVSEQRIISDNGLSSPYLLVPGQALIILFADVTYTVKSGDTLSLIADNYGTTVKALLRNNPTLTLNPNLTVGQDITISFRQKPLRTARINGYAYPFISQSLLRRELPFLSTLTIFGYGFTQDGELIPPDDTLLLRLALNAGVAPILLLSSITEEGNFSSEQANLLFNSTELQNTVLNKIVRVMRAKGYKGLDIDFEYVLPEDADAFLGFVRNATTTMRRYGYFVNVDLAPKTSVNQRGLLYEAHDYASLGAAADTVLLMTYEWGYTYGPPQAVAPIQPVTNVVNFAVTQIPTDKIMLGIPNYGYDWALPFQKGITRAETLGNEEAVALAVQVGATIEYDEASQSPFFTYRQQNVDHIVWFEDVRSIDAKLQLVINNELRGIGYWNLMRPFSQNWALISTSFIPETVE